VTVRKILYQSLDKTIEKGVVQTADYADMCGADTAYLLIFDRRTGVSWQDKIWQLPDREVGQRVVQVWGM